MIRYSYLRRPLKLSKSETKDQIVLSQAFVPMVGSCKLDQPSRTAFADIELFFKKMHQLSSARELQDPSDSAS